MAKNVLDFDNGPAYEGGQRPVKTGTWRVLRPQLDATRCNKCLLCWIFCPDAAVHRTEDGLTIDYEYCKGCGICAVECNVKAITMVREQTS